MVDVLNDDPRSAASTVFVVDDDDAVRDSITALLEINDRDVQPCVSAYHFLTCYQGEAYCLLLDVEMPEMTGLDLIQHLADTDKLPATVLLTAHVEESATQAALSLGIHAILPKPADERMLLTAIDGAASAYRGNPL